MRSHVLLSVQGEEWVYFYLWYVVLSCVSRFRSEERVAERVSVCGPGSNWHTAAVEPVCPLQAGG